MTITPRKWHGLVKSLAATPFGSWLLPKLLHRIDMLLFRITSNRICLTSLLTGLPVIILTHTGAKSGLQRQLPLVALQDGKNLILIASYFGSQRHPAWYFNLKANPRVEVSRGKQTAHFIARQALNEERRLYWSLAEQHYTGYHLYQSKAGSREIPVIVLEPLDSADK